jgi:hypothetical protein
VEERAGLLVTPLAAVADGPPTERGAQLVVVVVVWLNSNSNPNAIKTKTAKRKKCVGISCTRFSN